MNTFFSDTVTNLNVAEYHDCEDISGNTFDPFLKANLLLNIEIRKCSHEIFTKTVKLLSKEQIPVI